MPPLRQRSPRSAPIIPVVRALPSNPKHGDEIYFQSTAMAVLGARWHLVYNADSGSAYKWEWAGGSDVYTQVLGGILFTTTGSFTAVPGGPSLDLPLAGDYDIEWGGVLTPAVSAGQGVNVTLGHSSGGGTGFSILVTNPSASSSNIQASVMAKDRVTALPIGSLTMRYLVGVTNASISNAFINARPLRVG